MFLLAFCTLLGCSDLIIPHIISLVINLTSKESSFELQLKNEIIDMKRQLQTVSMVDQFPAYAKLQRKINGLTTQYKDRANERRAGMQKVKFILKVILRGLIILCCLWIVWNHRSSPVVALPSDLLWPIATILSLPSCQPGEISVVMWMAFVKTSSGRFLKIFQSAKVFDGSPKISFEGK